MCTAKIADDWFGIEKAKPVVAPAPQAPISIAPPAAAPTKTSQEIQDEADQERIKKSSSKNSTAGTTRLTGALGDSDYSSVRRVTLGG